MALYSIQLLGPPGLFGPEGAIHLPTAKAAALLWYLAAQPGSDFPRSHLAALLWGERSEAQARNSLRTALVWLRQRIPDVISVSADRVRFRPTAEVSTDLAQAMALLQDPEPGEPTLRRLAALLRGRFLDGAEVRDSESYENWLRDERRIWQHRHLDVLERLVKLEAGAGQWQAVREHAQAALLSDPLQERFHRWIMIAYYSLGDRAAALSHFAACQRLLRKELGVRPDPETLALRDAIAGGRSPLPAVSETDRQAFRRRLAATLPVRLPLIGRDGPLAELVAAVDDAAAAGGRVVLVSGEAGIGKSRLVEELLAARWADHASKPAGGSVLVGRCYEDFHELPYAPFVQALGRALPTLDLHRLNVPEVWLAEIARLLPELASLRPGLPELRRPSDSQEQQRLFTGVARLLSALPQPVVLVLEDLHWADEATFLLLAYLARYPGLRHLALLVTARTENRSGEMERLLWQLRREGRLYTLDLKPLTSEGVHRLLAAMTGRTHHRIGDRLFTLSRGNPFFAIELLRSWQQQSGGTPVEQPADIPAVPPAIHDLVQSRISRASESVRHLLSVTSVFPFGATFPVLTRVAGLDEETASVALDWLIRAGILAEAPPSGGSPHPMPQVIFCHDLVRTAVRARLSHARLQTLHQKAYTALETGVTPSAHLAEQLAHHASRGGLWEQGVTWYRRAADAAEAVYAFHAAVRFLEQAVQCLKELPPTPENRLLATDLRLRMAGVGHFFHPAKQQTWLRPVETEATALGDQFRLMEFWLAKSLAFTIQGRMPRAQSFYDRLLPLARRMGKQSLLGPALTFMGLMRAIRGEYDSAEGLLREALPIVDDLEVQLYKTSVRTFLSCIHSARGEFGQAEALLQPLIKLHRGLGDEALLGHVLTCAAVMNLFRGWWAEAAELGLESLHHTRVGAHRLHEYVASLVPGLALTHLGRIEAGVELQEFSVRLARRAHTWIYLDNAYAWLSEIYMAAGRLTEADEAARTGLHVARSQGYLLGAGLAEKALALALLAQGEGAAAEEAVRRALGQLESIRARPDAARCHALLASLTGDPEERQVHLRKAAETFEALEMRWDLDRLSLRPF